jgi:uncharacterized membrane-anchored protein
MTKRATSTMASRTQSRVFAVAIGGILAMVPQVHAQAASEFSQIGWEHGPAAARVGNLATMNIPKGFVFTQAAGAKKFLELTENPPSGAELGILAPEDLSWFAILSFSDIGYVRDDDKDSMDADAMLRSIQQGTEESNTERRRRGWSTISVVGWVQAPHYNSSTHNLEWSLKGRDEDGQVVVNHYTRFLGRRGVMTVDFVAGIDNFSTQLVTFKGAMDGFAYTRDNSYLAFVQGDKLAEYGLTGLVVGGTAIAAKAGLFKYLWKLIVAAFAAVGALIKKLFRPRQDQGAPQYR